MKIIISGTAGSGKSSVARELAKQLECKHYSSGDFMREMAAERKLSLLELSKLAEKDSSIDREIDDRQIKISAEEDNFVLDSRLGAFFIKDCIKIFLDADLRIRARRILGDLRKTEKHKNLKDAINNIKKREESEKNRYKYYYGINCYNKKIFDKVLDTTEKTIEETVEEILGFIKKWHQ